MNIKTEEYVAVKLEKTNTRHPQLYYEAKLYKYLDGGGKLSLTVVGIPQVYYYGTEGDYNVMVMEMLGPSLEDLFEYCKRKFTIKTVLMIAD